MSAAKAVHQVQEAMTDLVNTFRRNPDPVAQRRAQVVAANALRRAASLLDDDGRLTE
jgi:hypothetical protein